MLILALETSCDICSVALFDDETELSSFRFRHERRLSERLPDMVEFMLKDRGIALRDIEAFAVGLGPGSFTGVRVGVTLAKTWAHVLNRPLVGISSLDALAAAIPPLAGAVVAAVAPTRREEVVAAFYRAGSSSPIAIPAVVSHTDVAARARSLFPGHGGPVLIVGEPARSVLAAIGAERNATAIYGSAEASFVARLAANRLLRGESDDAFTLTPLYVTPPPVRGANGQLLSQV